MSRLYSHRSILVVLLAIAAIAAASPTSLAQTGLNFNGSNQYVTFGAATAELGVKTFTLEAWVKRASGGVTMTTGTGGLSAAYPVLTKGMGEGETPKNVNTNYFLGINSTGVIAADFEDSTTGGNHPVTGNTVVPTGEWHHIAATYDGRIWNLYLDGVLDKTLDLGATYIPEWRSIQHAALAIGINSTGGLATGRFSGAIDEPRVWGVVRSQAQISADYDSNLTAGTGLLGRWGLNDGTGTTASNSITGSPAGSLLNAPTWVDGPLVLMPPAVPPAAPSALSVTPASAYQLNLSWTDNSNNETSFQVWRSTDGGANFTQYATTASNAVSFQDTAVNSSAIYYYRVRAANSAGTSSYTSDAYATVSVEGSGALQFGSSNAYVTFGPATATLGAQTFTLECWFKRTGAGVTGTTGTGGVTSGIPLVTKGRGEADGSNLDMNYWLGIDNSTGRLAADFEDMATGANHPVYGTTAIANDAWYHAAATYDGTTWKLYLNGILEATLAVGQTPRYDNVQHAGLGTAMTSNGTAAGFFNGVMDEARIWNYARTAGEIADDINAQIVSPRTGLLARWGLNEGAGTRVHGNAGGFVNGTVTGSGSSWTTGAPFDLTFTPPAAPTNLVATPVSNSAIEIVWTDNASNEGGFEIERSTTGSGGPFSFLASVGANVTTYSDASLTPLTEYCYRVRATTGVLQSSYAGPACGTTLSISNSALNLGTSGAFVTFGAAPGLATQNFTVETWFKKTGTGRLSTTGSGGINIIPLVAKGSPQAEASTVDENYILGIQATTGVIAADFEEGTGSASPGLNHPITGTTVVTDNVWHHAAATFSNGVFSVYLDGVLEASSNPGSSVWPQGASVQHAGLGTLLNSTGADTGKFYGVLDEVRIWNYARTLSEIRSTVNAQIDGPQTGLLARWGLNEGAGTTVGSTAGATFDGAIAGTGYVWVPGAPFNLGNLPPDAPSLNSPADGATGVPTSTMLDVSVSDPDGDALTVNFYGRPDGVTGTPFSIVVLPDAQNYTSSASGGSPATFTAQTQWIVDNQVARNIKYVSMVGDITNENSTTAWVNANTTMSLLDATPPGIPYGIVLGNHDYVTPPTKYGDYFPASRFAGRPYYGGNLDANNENHFGLFSGGGMDFIVVNLSSGDQNPTATQLNWADSLLKAYPSRRGILVNHSVVNTGNPATFTGPGQTIYTALKDNPNLFLMLGGHVPGEGRRADTFNGNTVYSVLADYQSEANGGNGWLRIMEFDPANNQIHIKSYSPTLNSWKTASSSQFDLAYTMASGGAWQLLASNAGVPSGTGTTAAWTGLDPSSPYQWYATANDGHNTATSPTWGFTTGASGTTHVITATAHGSGTISPSGVVVVSDGATQSFTIAPNSGFAIDSVRVDGVNQGAVGTYQFTNVTADHAIDAWFSTSGYVITATASSGGSITPSGAVGVSPGGSQAFAVAASNGFHVDSVVVDGANLGVRASYAFTGVASSHAIAAYFSANQSFADAYYSVSALGPVSTTAETGEKPQSKVWLHDGKWWTVLSTSAGTHIYRLDGATWTSVYQLSTATDVHADVKKAGDVAHILLYRGTSSELASVQYNAGTASYAAWPSRGSNAAITLDSGVETATIDIDGTGRMWLASDAVTDIVVRWSDPPYSTWSSPVTLGTGVSSDDISNVAALPTGKVGVLWSNQNSKRYGFRIHADGADPATWGADEVPASQSAQNVGLGMADDHLHMTVGSDGTIYAAVKTSYDTPGYTKVALLVRRPWGAWDDMYPVDEAGTRGTVILNETERTLTYVYTSAEGYNDIVYRRSALSPVAFGTKHNLITGGYNNVTSMKDVDVNDVVYLASSASSTAGVITATHAPELVGHWAMDEGSGTSLVDSSTYGNDGTIAGSPSWISGMKGQALALNGTTQYATVPDASSLDITGQITMAVWVRPEKYGTQDLIKKALQGSVDGYELALASTTSGWPNRPFVRFNQATSADAYRLSAKATSTYPIDGTWMHIAATYDGATIRLYLNGALDTSMAASFAIATNATALGIGAQSDNQRWYQGRMDDARIYNRALSGSEILALASTTPPVTHTITATAGTNGSISPGGTVVVNEGDNQRFTITPNSGFLIDSVTVDGVKVDSTTSYTFVNVTASHTIDAWFKAGPSLVAHWAMEEGGGTTLVDSSTYLNDGSILGSPSWATGMRGQALSLNGASQYASVPDAASLDITSAITMSAWIQPNARGTQRVIYKTNGANGYELFLSANAPYYMSARFNGSAAQRVDSKTPYPINGDWVHLAATWDGSTMKLYVNGLLDSSRASSTAIVANTAVLGVGARGTGTEYFNGRMDDVRIYNRALDASEIFALAASSDTIMASAGPNGSITPSGTVVVSTGGSQAFAIDPATGYHVDSVIVDGVKVDSTTSYTFVNVTAAHTIRAVFAIDQYTITPTAGANGTITPSTPTLVNHGSNQAFAIAPSPGYHVDSVIVDGAKVDSTASYTFVNVTAAHTIRVVFKINAYTLTYTAGANGTITGTTPQSVNHGASGTQVTAVPNTGYHFVSWSDGVLTAARTDANVQGNITVTATFAINGYTLTYTAGANGTISGTNPQSVNHGASGTQVTAVPNTGYHFVSWSDGVLTAARTDANVQGNITVTATFAINAYTLTYTAGSNGTISGTTPQSVNHGASGTQVTAVPSTGYHFVSWSDGVLTAARTDANVQGNITVTATFAINQYSLVVNATNGTVIKSPNQTLYDSSTTVQLTATPAIGYSFAGWSGDATGTTNPLSVTMNANKTITALFTINQYTLTVNAANGSVTISPDQALYDSNATVQLTATPAGGYQFTGWSGDATGTTNPLSITMNGNKSITAEFTMIPVGVSAAVNKGWNLVSLPVDAESRDRLAHFPASTTPLYWYDDGYHSTETLEIGPGFWLKFPADDSPYLSGLPVNETEIPVVEGWNMIGSISVSVPVTAIASNPPGLVTGSFFGYEGGYRSAGAIEPGKGYWVKVSGPGTLILSGTPAVAGAGTINIVPDGENPPPPPGERDELASGPLPEEFALNQNYPNPFNPTTTVGYDLPVKSYVSISVCNLIGQEVVRLVGEEQEAGRRTVTFDASELPTGVYLCRMTAGDYVRVIRMILVK